MYFFGIILGAMILFEGAAHAQTGSISIELVSAKPYISPKNCQFFWNIINKTGLNITSLFYRPSLKEGDGSTMNSMHFGAGRLKNGIEVEYADYGFDTPCENVKTIKFNSIGNVEVDGNSRPDLKDRVADSVKFSSKVGSIKVIP